MMNHRAAMRGFKLVTVIRESVGLPVDETRAHETRYDIALILKMFKALMKTTALRRQ